MPIVIGLAVIGAITLVVLAWPWLVVLFKAMAVGAVAFFGSFTTTPVPTQPIVPTPQPAIACCAAQPTAAPVVTPTPDPSLKALEERLVQAEKGVGTAVANNNRLQAENEQLKRLLQAQHRPRPPDCDRDRDDGWSGPQRRLDRQ